MLPSILAGQLQKGIGDYIKTSFPMTNEPFKSSIDNLLAMKDSIYHEPYIAVRLPFRVADEMPTCFEAVHPEYKPYVHQQRAWDRLTGDDGRSTLVATGTGSGKTECFLYPILEYCYQHRGEPGIKALIIYPMNALASDQAKRIAKLIGKSPELKGNINVGMYVGGHDRNATRMMVFDEEKDDYRVITDHETMLNRAPDILMTNYKMLDYLLVRPKDAMLWQDNDSETLKYIAVDELHTFDGAQGTDLACLLRRLKRRLGIYDGYLCCVGTSATMGSKDNNSSIVEYASEIFGEPFERDSVITEDRLSAAEFFENESVEYFAMPTRKDVEVLNHCVAEDEIEPYLKQAVKSWFPEFEEDILSDDGRIALGRELMHHSFMQAVIRFTGGNYYQSSKIVEELSVHYPELRESPDATALINSLFALISHARNGDPGKLRPFLFVQVQLWMRELRRLVAKVDPENVTYEIAFDLNKQQSEEYLPVINCRDCGITGWVSMLNERGNASMKNLEAFYNRYFKTDDKIAMMFPRKHEERLPGTMAARLCPDCLQVTPGEDGSDVCPSCGAETIDVMIPNQIHTTSGRNKQYICPCCGSRRGLSIMGLRSATEISASLSQIFASRFNDDKKTLTFSDSVQDAAHRAGFFNSRTWRFGLRTAIQKYCTEFGAGRSLDEFQEGFIKYWHKRMDDEKFVSFFIPPNLTWKHAYEDMVEKRKFGKDKQAKVLMKEIEQRLQYEILLEYGLTGKIGRTLEKSGCSVISFNPKDISAIARRVEERSINELGVFTEERTEDYERMVVGYLNIMRQNGAFEDSAYDAYTKNGFKDYLLTSDYSRWMPGKQGGRNVPRFVADRLENARKSYDYDRPDARKYSDWIADCCRTIMVEESNFDAICRFILEAAVQQEVVSILPSLPEFRVYGLNKERVYISDSVKQMRCDTCGSVWAVSEENVQFWRGASCPRVNCSGNLEEDENIGLGYYGKLYSSGDMERINAREHTGMLERPEREQLEFDFKRTKETQELWDPNVLSCTPTLEMGIDIGDLSTVILCSMPPAQSQFLQRAGRAGRKDGNALTLAIANAKPHDLYFYSDPMDMIAGDVTPPRIFLRASAVLERQFVAFCMDSWVRKGIPEGAIPDQVGYVLTKLDTHPDDVFPFNFLNYVQRTLSRQLNSFFQMFAGSWGTPEEVAAIREELETFARGKKSEERSMAAVILDAFTSLRKQQDALRQSIDDLKAMIKALEAKPKDSSYDEEIKELKGEEAALYNVLQALGKKNIFNFLSDEGLLPNYAFPEAGIILKAVLYRKEDEPESEVPLIGKRKYEKMVYEYSRSASAAISEFAPNNSFYVDGRKLKIDQVDLTTAKTAKWRLCPSCSHAEPLEAGKHVASCPRCGSPEWADAGQIRNMLKVQMVYSNMDYTKSLISDESDDRTNVFYCKQLLVDVDEDNDISSAYRMDNQDFPFGYEFVRKATLREINFGESDNVGEKMYVSGVEEVRKGFKICKYCGKIQPDQGKPNHSYACKTRKMTALMQSDAYEECLFLYREFSTEVLRLLVPATTMDATDVKLESFVAAFMLGMKEYFGNVDHLRAAVSEVPVADADYRKQYLVIYDSVPGGTGYLKQLMHEKNALIEIFEKALYVMENCSCNNDGEKDGCYHCLYAYRQSRQIGSISRRAAVRMMKSILSGKDNVEKIRRINDIPTNPLFDSELEQRFIEAVRTKVGAGNLEDVVVNGRHGYRFKVNDMTWEIEPQVLLDAEQGVAVKSKPDFVFWPVSAPGHRPVAVFTDGFTYHKDIVDEDTIKREAIRRSGSFRVWSLSYRDVQAVFEPQGDYVTKTLDPHKMPSGTRMYAGASQPDKEGKLEPAKLEPFDLLMSYIALPDAEQLFHIHAYAYALSLLDPLLMKSKEAYTKWKEITDKAIDQTHFTDMDFAFPGTLFGTWVPRNIDAHLFIYAGVLPDRLKTGEPIAVCAVLDDEEKHRADSYEREWNGFLQFSNILQFDEEFIALSQTGLEQMEYLHLPYEASEDIAAGDTTENSAAEASWIALKDYLFGDEEKKFAAAAAAAGIPAPSENGFGYEVEGTKGEVIAEVAIAWPDHKIGFLTEDQLDDREVLEQNGWKIIDLFTLSDAAETLGGE